MAAAMIHVKLSFFEKFSGSSLFIPTDIYESFLVTRDYCLAAHESKFCLLEHFQYHILLIEGKK